MASFNKVILMGNLTRDPEFRVTPNGLAICKIGMAVNRIYKDKEGNRKEDTTFVDVDAFGNQAEVLSKYITKGSPLFLEGRLKFDTWEGPNGEKRSKMSVVLESFQFIGGNRGSGDGEGGGGDQSSRGGDYSSSENRSSAPPPRQQNSRPASSDDVEDDVPF